MRGDNGIPHVVSPEAEALQQGRLFRALLLPR